MKLLLWLKNRFKKDRTNLEIHTVKCPECKCGFYCVLKHYDIFISCPNCFLEYFIERVINNQDSKKLQLYLKSSQNFIIGRHKYGN